jgi:hypothetical protein
MKHKQRLTDVEQIRRKAAERTMRSISRAAVAGNSDNHRIDCVPAPSFKGFRQPVGVIALSDDWACVN